MATLKFLSLRIKSVKNIQKITKSMKMVSAAKFARAERDLKSARVFGEGVKAFGVKSDLNTDEIEKKNYLAILLSSDRGLCGSIHSNIVKKFRADLADELSNSNISLVIIGDKAKTMLMKHHKEKFAIILNDYGKKAPLFEDASRLADEIINSDIPFDSGNVYYNHYKSVISYSQIKIPLFPLAQLTSSSKMAIYDDIDEETMRCYYEFSIASCVYYAMKEAACSEQSSRMSAMESASKNAGEMIDRLTLKYNRTRQAVITKELIEIISGAAALK